MQRFKEIKHKMPDILKGLLHQFEFGQKWNDWKE
jgi:hypothetical protein